MSDVTYITGTISGKDPILRFVGDGKAVCNFSIRVPGQKANPKYGREAREAYFLDCSAWEQLGENVAESMRKGDRVLLMGLTGERTWTDKDNNEHKVKTFTAWDAALSVQYNCAEAVVQEHTTPESDALTAAGLQDF